MEKNIQRILISLVIFVIPLNIYIIGDWLGTGIQWILFRYQQTYMGTDYISVFDDLYYISSGNITGRSAISIQLWVLGVIILISSIIFLSVSRITNRNGKITGLLLISSGIFFLAAVIIQYGITLSGPAGISIPVGIPLIFVIGGYFLFYCHSDDTCEVDVVGLET
jgi:hypothetical protein